jgi:thiol:disulfide interchange protein DsbC
MLRALIFAIGLLPVAALADEAAIRKALEPLLAARVESVRATPIAGLFEVHVETEDGPRIVYTDARASHVLHGNIYEPRSGRNLTEERLRKLSEIPFHALPLNQAVKIRRGNEKRVLAVFSDPYCPACRQFEKTLQQADDITIHIFMIPVIRPDLADHSKAVWCSPDPARAWLDLALRGKPPAAKAACDNPVEQNVQLARRLRVQATPTLIFADGERHEGGLPLAELIRRLDHPAAAAQSAMPR